MSDAELRARIGRLLGDTPRIEWVVASADRSAYCLTTERRQEADEWLAKNLRDFPNGWVAKDGYRVVQRDIWPNYLSDEAASARLISFAFRRLGASTVSIEADGRFRVAADGRSAIADTLIGALVELLGLNLNVGGMIGVEPDPDA